MEIVKIVLAIFAENIYLVSECEKITCAEKIGIAAPKVKQKRPRRRAKSAKTRKNYRLPSPDIPAVSGFFAITAHEILCKKSISILTIYLDKITI